MARINLSFLCQELKPVIVDALKIKEVIEGVETSRDVPNIVLLSDETNVDKIKKELQAVLNFRNMSDYVIAENSEDAQEIAILKKGDLAQLGLFLCGYCATLFSSEVEKNLHERAHYFGFG